MSEFVDFREIVERLKDIISNEVEGFVFDKDIAQELGIPDSTFRFHIYKNKIPYFELSRFCFKRGIIINDIIFKRT